MASESLEGVLPSVVVDGGISFQANSNFDFIRPFFRRKIFKNDSELCHPCKSCIEPNTSRYDVRIPQVVRIDPLDETGKARLFLTRHS